MLGIVSGRTDLHGAFRDGWCQIDTLHVSTVRSCADEDTLRLNGCRHIPNQVERREAIERAVNGGQVHQATSVEDDIAAGLARALVFLTGHWLAANARKASRPPGLHHPTASRVESDNFQRFRAPSRDRFAGTVRADPH